MESPVPDNSPGELSVTIDGKRISWHAAAIDAFKLDLLEYAGCLEYIEEHTLTNEPLRIDIVIIKKKKEVVIKKNIAAIFKGQNLVEYKSPDDYLSLQDFHRVIAYAHLYCTPPDNNDIRDITVTFVTSREPVTVKTFLKDGCGYRLTETGPGITLIEGAMFPMQILERGRLEGKEALWLANLGRGISVSAMRSIVEETLKLPKGAPVQAYIKMLAKANISQLQCQQVKKFCPQIFADFYGLRRFWNENPCNPYTPCKSADCLGFLPA